MLPLSLTTVDNFADKNHFTRSPRAKTKVSQFMTAKPRVINFNESFKKNKDLDFSWDNDQYLKRDQKTVAKSMVLNKIDEFQRSSK